MYMTDEHRKAINAVAKELGATIEQGASSNYMYVNFEDGKQLGFFISHDAKDRAKIIGHFPKLEGRELRLMDFAYGKENPSIKSLLTKSPKAIANDILRKVMPMYTELFKEATEYVERRTKQTSEHKSMVDFVAKELNCESPRNLHSDMYRNGSDGIVTVNAYGSHIKMELDHLSKDQFSAVMALVNTF